jgi:hypothetical protein
LMILTKGPSQVDFLLGRHFQLLEQTRWKAILEGDQGAQVDRPDHQFEVG